MSEEQATPAPAEAAAPTEAPTAPAVAAASAEPALGIQEVKDVLVALNEVGIFLASRLKDGAGVDDVVALVTKLSTDDEFKLIIAAAVAAMKHVPAELKDLDLVEGVELAQLQLSYLPKIIAAAKK